MDFSLQILAMENPLLIHKTSNEFFIANICNEKSVAGLWASDYPLLIISIGIFVAEKSAMDKFVAEKSATTDLHPIFTVADSIAKIF